MQNLSYQEKSVYANLLILLAIFGSYLAYAVKLHSAIHLGGAIVLLIVLQIIGQGVLAAVTRRRLVDERDHQVKANGSRVGYIVLITCLWVSFGFFQTSASVSSLVVVNLLIAALVVAELSSLVAQLIAYRTSL